MSPRPTIANIVLAFRQAKVAVAAEREAVGLFAFAQFEIELQQRTKALRAVLTRDRWFDRVEIGRIAVCPKTTSPAAHLPPEDVVRVGTNVPSDVKVGVRLQLEPTPEFATVEVMYLWEFGGALESLLDDTCVGYRLKRVRNDGTMDRFSRDVYDYWPEAFARYRDDPVEAAAAALHRGERVLVTSTDVSSFFDSIDPSFMLADKFVGRLESTATPSGAPPFSAKRFLRATRSLLDRYADYRAQKILLGATDEDGRGIPIGSLISRVIANVALAGVDKHVQAVPYVLLYRRYVDDIVVVSKVAESLTRTQVLARLFPGHVASATADDAFVTPDTGKLFHLKGSKTRIHDLAGPTGLDFLEAVRQSFSAVTSERRAFLGDVERLTSEIEGLDLFEDGHESMSRLPRLRDADRYTLKRYIASSLIKGLERCALLLEPGEATSHLRRHTRRLLAVVNAEIQPEDFNLVLDLLKVALLCRAGDVAEQLDQWLARRVDDVGAKATDFVWKGAILPREKILAPMQAYLNRRIEEAKARACSWSGAATGGDVEMANVALTLRATDLRHLDRESDVDLFGVPDQRASGSGMSWGRDLEIGARLKALLKFLDRADQLGEHTWKGVKNCRTIATWRLLSSTAPGRSDDRGG